MNKPFDTLRGSTIRRTTAAIAAAAALLAGGQAQAASADASTDLYGLSYQLIDLDPSDGIAPAIAFHGTNDQVNATSESQTLTATGSSLFSPLNLSSSTNPYSIGSGSISGSPLQGTGELTGTAHADEEGIGHAAGAFVTVGNLSFKLAPETELVVTGHVAYSANTNNYDENVGADTYINLTGTAGDGSAVDQHYMNLDDIHHGAGTIAFTDAFSLSFSNASTRVGTGVFDIVMHDFAYSSGPPTASSVVPEPAGGALMLFGLAALGARVRRGRR